MNSSEWKDCTTTFSNGTEYEMFLDRCEHCTRYRNFRCRILIACEMARWDEKYFPYKDLLDHVRYGGKRCKHFTEEKHRRKHVEKQLPGQINIDDVMNN